MLRERVQVNYFVASLYIYSGLMFEAYDFFTVK